MNEGGEVPQTVISKATLPVGESKPLSQRMGMRPLLEKGTPRSSIYTEAKIRYDYKDFFGEMEGYDPNKSVEAIRRDLVSLYEKGEVTDFAQALEWAVARKTDEWDSSDLLMADWFIEQSKKDPKLHQPSEEDIAQIERARSEWRRRIRR